MRVVRRCDTCGRGFYLHDAEGLIEPPDHAFVPGSALIELTKEEADSIITDGKVHQHSLIYEVYFRLEEQR